MVLQLSTALWCLLEHAQEPLSFEGPTKLALSTELPLEVERTPTTHVDSSDGLSHKLSKQDKGTKTLRAPPDSLQRFHLNLRRFRDLASFLDKCAELPPVLALRSWNDAFRIEGWFDLLSVETKRCSQDRLASADELVECWANRTCKQSWYYALPFGSNLDV